MLGLGDFDNGFVKLGETKKKESVVVSEFPERGADWRFGRRDSFVDHLVCRGSHEADLICSRAHDEDRNRCFLTRQASRT